MTYLVTGSAGFIGFHTVQALLKRGDHVIGIDNFNDYYDVKLKEARNDILIKNANFKLYKADITNFSDLKKVFEENTIDKICHLAAYAGVRHSLTHPLDYVITNEQGTVNLLEYANNYKVKNFVYASSSSVYGGLKHLPFKETDLVGTPVSMYAATKRSNELAAHVYSHVYSLPCTGLRFFTVYGPWGRPDMALYLFTDGIMNDNEITINGHGDMTRDFTYIDDIVAGILHSLDKNYPYEIFNLGAGRQEGLMEFVQAIEHACGKKAAIKKADIPAGDVKDTLADISHAQVKLGYEPKTSIKEGIPQFIEWYASYHNTKG